MRSSKAWPPDGGYGWVVVASAFLIMGLTTAVVKNYGLFFLEIRSHFGVLVSTTSWVASIVIAVFHLGAPVASALSLQFSQRAVIMVGGLLTASGMVLASLDLSLPWLYLGMGLLPGIGISFSWIPANSMVSHYFLRWRPIAYSVASSGECVFSIVFSPFFQWLIDSYTWQGALLIIGGLQLNLCVCGALMRPLQTAQSTIQETKDSLDSKAPKRKVIFQCSLLRKPEFLFYVLFAIFTVTGFFIPPLFIVPFAKSLGMEQYWAASILSVLAMADLAGRLMCGWLANMRLWRNLQLLTMVVTLLGVVLLLLPIGQNYWALLVFSSLYGFLSGCMAAIHVTAIVDIVGLEGFDSGLGLFMLFRSAGCFVGVPSAGWLVDQTDGYSAAFYLSGACVILSGLFVVIVDRLVERRKASDAIEAASDSKVQQKVDKQNG
uniref:monocarboxylate transporter 13 n=1 Tax=Centroberyx gerrardi TaxID=166262 RepID=UPI003AAC77BD